MNVLRKSLGAPRRLLYGLAVRLLAKAAHLLMVISVRAYARGLLSQVEVRCLLECSSALNRASLKLTLGE
ncbi:hypothetical protein [Pseudomonas sp. TCU-HL1]|uniref:hypothetical protein n=1 Tax=Pseudomonas sp. TCU-HL1 TaxID=1856685 RepID=UPI00083E0E44|nr:hypothetical protein [Pseudomonas sp. TCU-HL1]AOE87666.1 hypothetical protein THL1_5118 [Pseudomonas sp. TCU-HL1]